MLLAENEKGMQLLKKDPVKFLPFFLDFEMHPNRDIIAAKLIAKYLINLRPDSPKEELIDALVKVVVFQF